MLQAKDLMTKNPEYVTPDTKADTAAHFLLKKHIPSAPVVIDEGAKLKLVGFLSELDCLKYCASQAYFSQPDVTVMEIMRVHPYCVKENLDFYSVARLIIDGSYKVLPVIDEDGYLVGILNRKKVLEEFLKEISNEDSRKAAKTNPKDLHELVNHRFIVG